MLSDAQLATIRAALRYWREEICPSGTDAAKPYFDDYIEKPLSARQVRTLERRFDATALRYVPYDRSTERIAAPRFLADSRSARRLKRQGFAVGTVLLD